jgi:uncharacterized protein YecE (DUF72 family)
MRPVTLNGNKDQLSTADDLSCRRSGTSMVAKSQLAAKLQKGGTMSAKLGATEFFVGTASWQEPDFIKHWYPKGLSKTKLLPYYAEHFNFVEVNGSFYGIPRVKTVETWCKQTPDDFVFTVKLHKLLSRHSTEAKFLPPDIRERASITNGKVDLSAKMEKLVAKRFRAGIQPLIDARKLGALLLQLSPSFRPKTNELSELENLFGLFEEFPLAVELRNRDWLTGEQTKRTVEFFQKAGVCLVSVDTPESNHFTVMPNTDHLTTPKLFYFRAHGRNEEAFVKGRTVQERFNYDYSEEELIGIEERLANFDKEAHRIFAVFNNNRHRFAPKAAARLQERLHERFPSQISSPKMPDLALI